MGLGWSSGAASGFSKTPTIWPRSLMPNATVFGAPGKSIGVKVPAAPLREQESVELGANWRR